MVDHSLTSRPQTKKVIYLSLLSLSPFSLRIVVGAANHESSCLAGHTKRYSLWETLKKVGVPTDRGILSSNERAKSTKGGLPSYYSPVILLAHINAQSPCFALLLLALLPSTSIACFHCLDLLAKWTSPNQEKKNNVKAKASCSCLKENHVQNYIQKTIYTTLL